MASYIHEPLTVADLFAAASVISATLEHLDGETIEQMRQGSTDSMQAGKQVIQVGLRIAPNAGAEFLASITDMTSDELKAQPATFVLDVLEELSSRDDVADFMQRARNLAGSWFTEAEGSS